MRYMLAIIILVCVIAVVTVNYKKTDSVLASYSDLYKKPKPTFIIIHKNHSQPPLIMLFDCSKRDKLEELQVMTVDQPSEQATNK